MLDRYLYLEDVLSTESASFINENNNKTNEYFRTSEIEVFSDEILKIANTDLRGIPYKAKKRQFWIERRKEWDAVKLMVASNGTEDILLDIKVGTSLDYWFPSPSGKKLLYGTSQNGNEVTTLHVIDVVTKKEIIQPIEYAGFTDQGSICWLHNESGFIYPRMNGFSKKGPSDKWLLGTKLYLHSIGRNAVDDQCVFGEGLPETVMLIPTLTENDSWLVVSACEDELTHQLYLVELKTLQSRCINNKSHSANYVTLYKDKIYVTTNDGAEKYRLLSCDINEVPSLFDDWDELLPESDAVLKECFIKNTGDIITHYSNGLSSEIRVFDSYGNQTSRIALPTKGSSIAYLQATDTNKMIYVMYTGYTVPTTIAYISDQNNALTPIWQRQQLAGDDEMFVETLMAVSRDGTEIPYTVIRQTNNHKPSPAIMYGYGGFNIALEPFYISSQRAWIRRGGIYIIMHLRGGSEFGEEWHRVGSREYKQNTFDDCIAIAEDVINRGLAEPAHIGVMGGSNGGLLVAAVTLQRPDLFRAGVALVPLTDMLEFYKHNVAEFWVHEYGDPRIPSQREWIKKWSPYHYPISKASYPALYYETALLDARVHPFHALKMVARLNTEVHSWKGPLILRTYTDTGHQGSNLSKKVIARRTAEYYAFFARELGLL